MADAKISALPAASQPLTGTEPAAVVQGGVTVQAPANAFGAAQHTNEYFVAKDGSDANGNGSQVAPFLTVAAAFTAIGDAASDAIWNDAAQRYYVVNIGPGVYTEVITNVPVRPYVLVRFDGASCVGNWTRTFPQNLVATGIGSPVLILEGTGLRSGWDGTAQFPHVGVDGDLNFINNGQAAHAFWFPRYELLNIAVDGNVNFSVPAGTANQQAFYRDAFISGVTDNTGGAGAHVTMVAEGGQGNEVGGDIEGVGGFTGNIVLFRLNDVFISNASSPTGATLGGNWYNVRLNDAVTLDFSGSTQPIGMDGNSWREYVNATSQAERFNASHSALDGQNRFTVGTDGAFGTIQKAVDQAESESIPANIEIAPGNYAEDVTITKPGINLIAAGAGDRLSTSTDITVITGDVTHTLTAAGVNGHQNLVVLGEMSITGTFANLVYLSRCKVLNSAGSALVGTNTNSTSRFIADGCYFESTSGTDPAMDLSGSTAFDGQRGVNEFAGTDAADICINISANGTGIIAVDNRIGGQVRTSGNGTVSLRGGTLGDGAKPVVDRTGATGGIIFLNEVQLFGQAATNLFTNEGGVATVANCINFQGTNNSTTTTTALYTPAVTGDWTGADPTTIAAALDRIAAQITPVA